MNLEDLGIVLTELFGVKENLVAQHWPTAVSASQRPPADLLRTQLPQHRAEVHAGQMAGNGRVRLEVTEQSAEQPNHGREWSC